jgi:hypothetical protein
VKLHAGRQVFIRTILLSDAPELARAIKTADADSLRRRLLGGSAPGHLRVARAPTGNEAAEVAVALEQRDAAATSTADRVQPPHPPPTTRPVGGPAGL